MIVVIFISKIQENLRTLRNTQRRYYLFYLAISYHCNYRKFKIMRINNAVNSLFNADSKISLDFEFSFFAACSLNLSIIYN